MVLPVDFETRVCLWEKATLYFSTAGQSPDSRTVALKSEHGVTETKKSRNAINDVPITFGI